MERPRMPWAMLNPCHRIVVGISYFKQGRRHDMLSNVGTVSVILFPPEPSLVIQKISDLKPNFAHGPFLLGGCKRTAPTNVSLQKYLKRRRFC